MNRKAFCARMWGELVAFSKRNGLFAPGDSVLAGLSGGPDSVCLLHFISQLGRRTGFAVGACHVNHGLRGKKSDSDAVFSKELCKKLGVKFYLKNVSAGRYVKSEGLSLEHSARKARYKAFGQVARRYGFNKVALGHQLDDQVETMLLNLLRGTNPRGLAGIPVARKLEASGRITIVRPLMCIKRGEIMEYLAQHGLRHRQDETNLSERFTRNWIRKSLLPLIEKKQPRFREHMLEISRNLRALINGKSRR